MSNNIHPTGTNPQVLEKNAQHVGRQAEAISKKDLDRIASANERDNALKGPAIEDRVDFTGAAEKAGAQTGLMQNLGLKETKPLDASPSALTAETGETPPPFGGEQPAPPPPSTPYTDAANRAKQIQDDIQQANQIYIQMAAERKKHMMMIWKILQDLQTEIFEMIQQSVVLRYKTMEAIANKWAAVLGGYDK